MLVPFTTFGPEQVLGALNKKKMKGVHFMGRGGVPTLRGIEHLVVFSFLDVESNMPMLRMAAKRCNVYVFGTVFDMDRWGLKPVDECLDSIMDFNFKKPPEQRPKRKPSDNMCEYVLDHVRKHSLFGELMSVIYKLPSKASQPAATTLCCKWLVSKDSIEQLAEDLKTATKRRDEIRLEILKVMQAPIALRLRKALTEVNGIDDSEHVTAVARANKVPAYEISYVMGHLNKKLSAIDKYVANVGEED